MKSIFNSHNILLKALLALALCLVSVHAWGGSDYYANLKITVQESCGKGSVYLRETNKLSKLGQLDSLDATDDEATVVIAFTVEQPGNGYEFYWKNVENGAATGDKQTSTSVSIDASASKDDLNKRVYKEIYAYFHRIDYTITYKDDKGGTGTLSPTTYNIESMEVLPTLTKDGYTFNGWKPSSSEGKWNSDETYPGGTSLTGKYGTVTLVAQWDPISYNITYKDDEGGTYSLSPTTYNIESMEVLPPLTKNGFKFKGWKPSRSEGNWDSAQTYSGGTSLTGKYGTVTLVAQWTADEYTITFDTNGGTPTTYDEKTYHITDAPFDLPTPTKDGYTFAGWQPSSSVGNWVETQIYNGSQSNMWGTVELVAQWDPLEYYIYFYPNGGEFEDGGKDVINKSYNSDGSDPSGKGLINKLPKVSRVGYDFLGWSVSSDDDRVYDWGDTVEAEASVVGKRGNVTLTAQWTPVNYQIDLNLNGGTLSDGATETTYRYNIEGNGDRNISELPKVEKTGYSFNGWKVTKTDEDSWWKDHTPGVDDNEMSVKGKWGNVTLEAQWEAIPGYIKISVSGLQKNDSAVFEVSYDSVPFVVSLDSSNASGLLVKIPDVRDGKSVTVTPKAWPKNYKGLTTTPKEKIVKFSNVRDKPVSYEFDLGERNLNIFETSREF